MWKSDHRFKIYCSLKLVTILGVAFFMPGRVQNIAGFELYRVALKKCKNTYGTYYNKILKI